MVTDKQTLNEYLSYERKLYPQGSRIYKYIELLRKSELYYNLYNNAGGTKDILSRALSSS